MFVSIRCFTLVILFLAGSLHCAQILPHGSGWRYFKGFSEASAPDSAAWRELAFDDSLWPTGATPFFYGELLSGTELADMRNQYSSLFLRRTFSLTNSAIVQELQLRVLSDDGFIAWINGREIARY